MERWYTEIANSKLRNWETVEVAKNELAAEEQYEKWKTKIFVGKVPPHFGFIDMIRLRRLTNVSSHTERIVRSWFPVIGT